jgi:hypothetical protein
VEHNTILDIHLDLEVLVVLSLLEYQQVLEVLEVLVVLPVLEVPQVLVHLVDLVDLEFQLVLEVLVVQVTFLLDRGVLVHHQVLAVLQDPQILLVLLVLV